MPESDFFTPENELNVVVIERNVDENVDFNVDNDSENVHVDEPDHGDLEHEFNVDENDVNNAENDAYLLARDRTRRVPRIPSRFNDFDMLSCAFSVFDKLDGNKSRTFNEAIKSKNSKEWLEAMQDEMNSLYKNNIWSLVQKPSNCSLVDCNWIYKVKSESENVNLKFV